MKDLIVDEAAQPDAEAISPTIQVGEPVYYLSYGKHLYDAQIARVYEQGICDLVVYDSADGKVPAGSTVVSHAVYDSEGKQPHSWRNKSTQVKKP